MIFILGNTMVLWLLGFCLRRNSISLYILNPAVVELLIPCFLTLNSLLDAIGLLHHFSVLMPMILVSGAMIPYIAGLSLLSAISTECCLSVLWPIWYCCHCLRCFSVFMCAHLWTLSLLLNILEWCNTGFLTQFFDGDWWKKVDVIIAAWLVILFVTLLVRILCGSHRVPLTRLCVTIMVTVLGFIICGLPFGIYSFFLYWLQMSFDDIFCKFFLVILVLHCVNSSANPLIYFFVSSFRQQKCLTLKQVLQRAL